MYSVCVKEVVEGWQSGGSACLSVELLLQPFSLLFLHRHSVLQDDYWVLPDHPELDSVYQMLRSRHLPLLLPPYYTAGRLASALAASRWPLGSLFWRVAAARIKQSQKQRVRAHSLNPEP